MKSILVALSLCMMSAVSFAQQTVDPTAKSNFESALKLKVGDLTHSEELRLGIEDAGGPYCGGDEPSLKAALEVRKFVRELDADDNVTLVEKFETVQTYYVNISDAKTKSGADLAKEINSGDACLE